MYTHCISRELRLHMMSAALTLATVSYILCFFYSVDVIYRRYVIEPFTFEKPDSRHERAHALVLTTNRVNRDSDCTIALEYKTFFRINCCLFVTYCKVMFLNTSQLLVILSRRCLKRNALF